MARAGWLVVILGVYLLHQDFWFWREPRPLVFGFLPVGLAYHGAYCIVVAGLMWMLTRVAWPVSLEGQAGGHPGAAPARGTSAHIDKDSRR
jgi:hypothetical protein